MDNFENSHFKMHDEEDILNDSECLNDNEYLNDSEYLIEEKNEHSRVGEFYNYYKNQVAFYEPPPSEKIKKLPLIIAFLFVFGIAAGMVIIDFTRSAIKKNNYHLSLVSNEHNLDLKDENGEFTTVGIAEFVMPSIVEIYKYDYSLSKSVPVSSSSGIILTTDGYIVTNEHCVADADKIDVILTENVSYIAEIVGRDARSDIAVIKINTTGLTPAVFADSNNVKLGEKCVAVGNPAGFKGSISTGIISGLKRLISTGVTGYEMECFQTDAAISPGNSGGALCNMFGEVIGITSSKQTGYSYEGLGFAITVNAAKPIIEDLIQNGTITDRYRLGVSLFETSKDGADIAFKEITGYDLPADVTGIVVSEIAADCRVAESDLQLYDIIVKADDIEIDKHSSLLEIIQNHDGEKPLHLEVVRVQKNGYETIDIEVYLTKEVTESF
jgi:serine protease Do